MDKAPIVEAVIEIRVDSVGVWEESSVREQIIPMLPDYPTVKSQTEVSSEMQVKLDQKAAQPKAFTQETRWYGLQFYSSDKKHIAHFSRNKFSFSRLEPYQNWEQLYGEAIRLWLFYKELTNSKDAPRVGLRYINRIQLPPGGNIRLENYIVRFPEPPKGVNSYPVAEFFHRETNLVPDYPYAVKITRALQHSKEDAAIILDIDAFTSQGAISLAQDDLEKTLLELRWVKNKFFFGSITKKSLESFK